MPTVVNSTIAGDAPDYTTPELWESDTDNDLVTLDEQHNGQLQVEFPVSSQLTMAGATTDSTRYRNLTFGGEGSAYDPISDTGAGLTTAGNFVLNVIEANFRASNIHLEGVCTAGSNGLVGAPATSLFDGCTVRNTGTTGSCFRGGASQWRNCIFLSGGLQACRFDTSEDIILYNCVGYDTGVSTRIFWFRSADAVTTVIQNTIAMGAASGDFQFDDTSADGTYSNNISEDTTATDIGTASFGNETDTEIFTAPGSDIFTLVAGSNAVDNGVDLSGTFTTSFDGTTRTTPWDIGAYDFVSGDALVQVVDETVQIPETTVRAMVMIRRVDEIVQLLETTVRPRVMVRLVDEVEQVEEGTLRPRVMVRLVDEVEQIIDAVEQHRAITQIVDEVEQIPETVARALGIIQVVNEIMQIVEATEQHRAITQLVNEVVELPETIFRPRVMVRLVDEIVQLLETTTRPRALVRVVSELVEIPETTVRNLSLGGAAGPTVIIDVVLGAVSADVPLVSLIADVNLPALSADIS